MKNTWLTVIAGSLCLLFISMSGCSSNPATQKYADNPVAQRETLAQISTIDAILSGVYDGVVNFGTLKKYGDFGIGTFEGLDGEMLGFDGNFYQVKADGIAYHVSDSMETPFASVTFFEIDCNQDLPEGIDYEQLQDFLDGVLPTGNIFYAIKIEGMFSYMKTRSVPAQEKPSPLWLRLLRTSQLLNSMMWKEQLLGFDVPLTLPVLMYQDTISIS